MPTSDGSPFSAVPYASFTSFTPVLPAFYYDVYSSEQRVKAICKEIDKLINYADMLDVNLNATHDDVVALQEELQNLKDGGLLDYYEKQIQTWIDANMERLIERAIKFVYFGLTSDGYFCAYIPNSWDGITFDTGAVYGRSDYGRLILKMQVDSPNSIDNTYEYSLAQTTTLQKLIADLEVNTKRTDSTFDTLFTNLDSEVAAPQGNKQQTPKVLVKDGENV